MKGQSWPRVFGDLGGRWGVGLTTPGLRQALPPQHRTTLEGNDLLDFRRPGHFHVQTVGAEAHNALLQTVSRGEVAQAGLDRAAIILGPQATDGNGHLIECQADHLPAGVFLTSASKTPLRDRRAAASARQQWLRANPTIRERHASSADQSCLRQRLSFFIPI